MRADAQRTLFLVSRAVAILLTIFVALAVGAGGGAYVWQRLQPTPIPPLERDWRATVAVLAGDGVQGTIDGTAARARFSEPFGIVAAPDGTIFVADAGHAHRIRRISADGGVSTVAGGASGFTDGDGAGAAFSTPSGLALGADGTLYLADTGNHAIRRITPSGQVSTLAGDGIPGYTDGPAHQARFNGPIGIAVAPDGRIVIADTYNDRIRVIDAGGTVTTLAGSGYPGADDGVADSASFDTPTGIAIDARGMIYVADTGNRVVRTVDQHGRVTTPVWAYGDGFSRPLGIAVGTDGELYVADEGGRIVAIRSDGGIRTLAGAGLGFRDGAGGIAQFRSPSGVALLRPGHLVVADAANALVRAVVATSQLQLQLPTSPTIRPQFDAGGVRLGTAARGRWHRFRVHTKSPAASARYAAAAMSDSTVASTYASSRGRASTLSVTASSRAPSRTMASVRSTSGCALVRSPTSTSAPAVAATICSTRLALPRPTTAAG